MSAAMKPTKEDLMHAIFDKVARAEDLMSDFPPHRGMERYNEACATLKEIIDQLYATPPQGELSALPELDVHLDAVLRASGSSLRNYSMHKPLEEMRAAMRAYGLLCRQSGDAADKRDAERLEFMMEHEAWIAWSKDGESCRLFHRSEDGEPMPMLGWGARHWSHDPREAIDAAIAQRQEGGNADQT